MTAGLSASVVAEIRARLEEERDRLLRRVGAPREVLTSTGTSGHGETEHVQIDIDRAIDDVLQGSAREALADIALALARLDDGSYGTCSSCGVPIPPARLEAIPTTHRCLGCQAQRERGR